MANTEEAPPNHVFLTPIITIIVGTGNEAKTFHVHEGLLTDESQYFKAALRSNMVEAETKTFKLDEDHPGAFHLFVHYIYKLDDRLPEDVRLGDRPGFQTHCAHAFVLSLKLLAEGFKWWIIKKVADDITELTVSMPNLLEYAGIVYSGTSKQDGVKMRKVLAIYCAWRFTEKGAYGIGGWDSEDRLELVGHQDFAADVIGQITHVNTADISGIMGNLYNSYIAD